MEDIKWLDVVLDYGKRFPNVTYADLFGDGITNRNFCNVNICELALLHNGLYYANMWYFLNFKNKFEYYNPHEKFGDGWSLVPVNICLRLLTEGKEDLI